MVCEAGHAWMRRCSANDNISLIVCYEHAPFSGVRCFSPTLLRWFLRGPGIAVGGTAYSSPCSGVSPCHCPHPSLYHTICTAAEHVCLRSWALHPHLSVLVPGRTTSRAPLFGPSANRSWLNRRCPRPLGVSLMSGTRRSVMHAPMSADQPVFAADTHPAHLQSALGHEPYQRC